MNIGSSIRKIRELKGYSQEYVSSQLGISQRQLSRIENKQSDIGISKLQDICTILEINIIELLIFDEKNIFQNCANQGGETYNANHFMGIPEKEKELYKKQIIQLQEELVFLKRQFEMLLKK